MLTGSSVCRSRRARLGKRKSETVIRNIIFDWSGTLVDDLPMVLQATNHVLRRAGVEEMTKEQFRAEFSLPFTDFYQRFVSHIPLPQLEEWFHGHCHELQDSVEALPHAAVFLEFCQQNGVRTFILTAVPSDHFMIQARQVGLESYLGPLYVGVRDKRLKIKEILDEQKLVPEETLFIGDMQHDIEAAHHGEIHSCAVLTGYNRLSQLRDSRPHLIVEHLGELREILHQSDMEWSPESRTDSRPVATVGALIFNGSDEVLMVRTHKWSHLWGIPGGKIRWGEPALDALKRELREETGLEVGEIQFVLCQDCIHSSEFYRDAHFILLNYTCRCENGTVVKLNEEAQDYRWVALQSALEMELNQPTRTLIKAVSLDGNP